MVIDAVELPRIAALKPASAIPALVSSLTEVIIPQSKLDELMARITQVDTLEVRVDALEARMAHSQPAGQAYFEHKCDSTRPSPESASPGATPPTTSPLSARSTGARSAVSMLGTPQPVFASRHGSQADLDEFDSGSRQCDSVQFAIPQALAIAPSGLPRPFLPTALTSGLASYEIPRRSSQGRPHEETIPAMPTSFDQVSITSLPPVRSLVGTR